MTHHRGNRRRAYRRTFLDTGVALLPRQAQALEQFNVRARRIRPQFQWSVHGLAFYQRQGFGIAHARQPRMPGGRVKQRCIAAHVRVVTQAGAGPLGLGDPGLPLAVYDAQAHQFTGFLSQAIEHRLHDIGATARQITEPHRHQLGRQVVAQVLRVLSHITEANQLRQHAMGGALGDVQLLCQGLHRQATGVAGEAFKHTENTFDLTAGHGSFHAKFARF